MTGEVLAGRYLIGGLLGRGGAGEVWRADDLELQRVVAVKLLTPRPDQTWDQIRAEARKAARLDHPNVVTVYDVGVDGDQAFMVMELVEGPNLAQLLRSDSSGRAEPGLVTEIALQMPAAIDAAHAVGIVHCDIKPGNLLLTSDGTVKVGDFGIATTDRDPRSGSLLVGTASYVSPEQVRGQPASELSDWYALGCVLYELLAGRPPFTGESVEDVLSQHVHVAPVAIQSLQPETDAGLAAVIMRLLAKDPSQRPASLASIREAVRPRHSGDRTRVLPQLEIPAVPERPRSRPYLLLVGGVVTAALLIAAAIAFIRDDGGSGTPAAGTPAGVPSATAPGQTPTPSPLSRETPSARATTPRPSVTASSRTDASVALASLARLLRQNSGGQDGDVAREAAKDADEAGREFAGGRADKATEKYRDLRKRLAEAERDGRWSPTPEITALLLQLEAAFPTSN